MAANGEWFVAVDNVKQTQDNDNLLLNLILEQAVDEENFLSRKLGVAVPGAVARDPETCAQILDQIRVWMEKSEGDGFLDLVPHGR
jgi:hypothetical protein